MLKLNDFKCKDCGFDFEKLSRADIAECPKCGAIATKQFAANAIKVKGDGAYTNKMKV